MSGKRKKEFSLPVRMYCKNKAFYYGVRDVYKKLKWIPLGSDYYEALSNYADVHKKYNQGDNILIKGTFDELVNEYLIHETPNKSKASQENDKHFIKKLLDVFGKMKLSNISSTHIAQFLDKSKKKVAANRQISLMSSIYAKGIRWGYCTVNPCAGIARNKEAARERYITDDELKIMRNMASPSLRCMMDLAYLTGMRRGDILDLRKSKPLVTDIKEKISYIDKLTLFVHQKKTGKRLNYKIEGMLKIVIERSLEISNPESEYLFTNTAGNAYTKTAFDSLWTRFIKKLTVKDVHFHDLRAKAATDAKKLGRDAQKLLGHTDAKMTEVYIRNRQIDEVEALHSSLVMLEG